MEECCAGIGSAAEGAGKLTARDLLNLFDAAFSSCWEQGGWRLQEHRAPTCLLLPRGSRTSPDPMGECEHWHPPTLHPCIVPASSPHTSGWKCSCLPLEVGLYPLRAQPCFIELFP